MKNDEDGVKVIELGTFRGHGRGGLGALLAGVLAGMAPEGAGEDDHPLLKAIRETSLSPFRPATIDEFREFFKPVQKLEIGDVVMQRTDIAENDKWPAAGKEVAIISQVLDTPRYHGETGTANAAVPKDVALAFLERINTEAQLMVEPGKAPTRGRFVEFLYDSRRLMKIGNINDSDIEAKIKKAQKK